MYEEFLRDPAAVGPEWRRLFESGVVGERDGGAGPSASPAATSRPDGGQLPAPLAAPAARIPGPAAPPASGASPIKGPAAKLVANMTESLSVPTATTFRE